MVGPGGMPQVLVEVGAACESPAKQQTYTALLLLALAFLRSVSVEVQPPREPSPQLGKGAGSSRHSVPGLWHHLISMF